ncbi:MAG TPA: zinc ribbon domain-containing protein [Terriglobales bacterium]|nr:zinc ribbon domain-containing protein [Terriglobales bacterium]
MPIYEYICRSCEKQFEAIVNGSQQAHCPACDSIELDQQLSAFAVGSPKGKGTFAKSAPAAKSGGGCGSCGDPRGPGSCKSN